MRRLYQTLYIQSVHRSQVIYKGGSQTSRQTQKGEREERQQAYTQLPL